MLAKVSIHLNYQILVKQFFRFFSHSFSFLETSSKGRYGYILKENTLEILLQDYYLGQKNLVRAKIPRDGNCLFRCFAQGVWGDQGRYDEMRHNIVKGIREQWVLFQNIIGDTDKEKYLQEMSKDGTYGGEPEIQAVCHLHNVKARIYLGGLNYGIHERDYSGTDNDSKSCFSLCYVSDGKYDSGHYDYVVQTLGEAMQIEDGYEQWRANKLIEMSQSPSNYDSSFYGKYSTEDILTVAITK